MTIKHHYCITSFLKNENRYLTLEGKRRWETEFLHDPKRGVIVVTTCGGTSNQKAIEENPILGFGCENDTKIFNNYDFNDLLNTTFSLVIHGNKLYFTIRKKNICLHNYH